MLRWAALSAGILVTGAFVWICFTGGVELEAERTPSSEGTSVVISTNSPPIDVGLVNPVPSEKAVADASSDRKDVRRPTEDKRGRQTAMGPEDDGLESEEHQLCEKLQAAMDDDDFDRVMVQAKAAATSTNIAVRSKAVGALRWFGKKALPELTLFMADDDNDVRTEAIEAWTAGVSQMESGDEKARTVLLGLQVVMDREQLQSMVMQVDDLSDFQKLDVLTRVIEGGNAVSAAAAREHYKFWTEEDYTTIDAAESWLQKQGDTSK